MKKKLKAPKPSTASKRTPSSKASSSSTANLSKWTRIDKPFALPAYVKATLQKLDDAGHIAYVVGGSVRDFLLGRESKDHDIATSASPDELCELFPNAVTVGKAFGVLKIPVKNSENGPDFVEIATFRQDLDYQDHRHPTGVLFSGPYEDAQRRDFTVNALFYDPKTSRILDSVEGMVDIKARVIRAIGSPLERFTEDALRLLRAVRFTTSLGFTLDPSTAVAVHARAKLIKKVSAERTNVELTLMWNGKSPELALKLLSEMGLLTFVLPELEDLKGIQQPPLEGDLWQQTQRSLRVLQKLYPRRTSVLSWAVLLHEIGKPAASKRSLGKNFNGHEIDAARMAIGIGERLKMSKADVMAIATLIEDSLKFKDVFQMREATLQRLIRQPYFEDLLAVHKVIATASDGDLLAYQFCSTKYEEYKSNSGEKESKLVTGEDLIQLGFRPGPTFSEILNTVEDLALEKKLRSKEEALEYVVKHFVS